MGELSHMIEQRLNDAYESLHSANADGDLSLADARQAEIEDLYRIAADNDIQPPVRG
ncbi:MAG: hypothetical protein JWO67_1873 [Streptosporangiaceae bacterium]|jgi:hypothetical protein|nr:hypothetical protein [Streptosporangiaceae bacterium]